MNRVLSVNLGLSFRHIVFGALLIRLEAELGKAECGKQTGGNCLSFFHRYILACDDTGCGVVGSKMRCILFLLTAEAAVNREHADWKRPLVPHLGKRDEPAACHVGTERGSGGFRCKVLELREDGI